MNGTPTSTGCDVVFVECAKGAVILCKRISGGLVVGYSTRRTGPAPLEYEM